MEDIIQPLLVILIGGLFAPILTQLIEKAYEATSSHQVVQKPGVNDSKAVKTRKWIRFLLFAAIVQLLLFTCFFFATKWAYFDKSYFPTVERDLIRIGIKKNKDYVIPKMTIRIYSEAPRIAGLPQDTCEGSRINYCMLASISYDIVALRDFNSEKLFSEQYNALYAKDIIKEPGSEIESSDLNPTKTTLVYDLTTSMKKFEHRTVTTRADYFYDSLPQMQKFLDQVVNGNKMDLFIYPNNEDDVIGEVEFQVISRSLKFNAPQDGDGLLEDSKGTKLSLKPNLTISQEGGCTPFNILTIKVDHLPNNARIGMKWTWQ